MTIQRYLVQFGLIKKRWIEEKNLIKYI
jgi:hypothetical protein